MLIYADNTHRFISNQPPHLINLSVTRYFQMQSQDFNIDAFITIQVLQLKVKCLIYIKYILIHWLYIYSVNLS